MAEAKNTVLNKLSNGQELMYNKGENVPI